MIDPSPGDLVRVFSKSGDAFDDGVAVFMGHDHHCQPGEGRHDHSWVLTTLGPLRFWHGGWRFQVISRFIDSEDPDDPIIRWIRCV